MLLFMISLLVSAGVVGSWVWLVGPDTIRQFRVQIVPVEPPPVKPEFDPRNYVDRAEHEALRFEFAAQREQAERVEADLSMLKSLLLQALIPPHLQDVPASEAEAPAPTPVPTPASPPKKASSKSAPSAQRNR